MSTEAQLFESLIIVTLAVLANFLSTGTGENLGFSQAMTGFCARQRKERDSHEETANF